MTLEEMQRRKREFGYSNEKLAELSGVPLGTVQKVMSGSTKSPRQGTLEALASRAEGNERKYEEPEAGNAGSAGQGAKRSEGGADQVSGRDDRRMYQSAQRALGRICGKERGVYN